MMEKMRRQDRQVDMAEIKQIVADNHVAHLGLFDGLFPYVVPVNYGYEWQGDQLVVYVHGAKEGKKLNCIARHHEVCVEIDGQHQLMSAGDNACGYSFAYQSVIGYGEAEIAAETNYVLKRKAIDAMMYHETGQHLTEFKPIPDAALKGMQVIRITLHQISGKAHHISG